MRLVWGYFRLLTFLCVFCLALQTSWAQVGNEPKEYVSHHRDSATTNKKMDMNAKKRATSSFSTVAREDPITWPKTQKLMQAQKPRDSATSSKAFYLKHPMKSFYFEYPSRSDLQQPSHKEGRSDPFSQYFQRPSYRSSSIPSVPPFGSLSAPQFL